MDQSWREIGPDHATDEAGKIEQHVRIVCVATLLSTVMFAGLGWWMVKTQGFEGPLVDAGPPLFWGLAGVGIALLVLAHVVERWMIGGPPAPSGEPTSGEPMDERQGLSRLERYRKAKVLGSGLREAVAGLGFVVGFLAADLRWTYALTALAALAVLSAWPRASELAARPGDAPPSASGSVEPR